MYGAPPYPCNLSRHRHLSRDASGT